MLRHCAALAAGMLVLSSAETVGAYASFKVLASGAAFDDMKQTEPVGGNEGRTLGEQRTLAFQYALDLWSRQLFSTIPIAVEVTFDDLGCGGGSMPLAGASPMGYARLMDSPDADPELFYPIALANALAGEDINASAPEIHLEINSAPDKDCTAVSGGFYYGFDGKAGEANDFVDVILHELAHGLGFGVSVSLETGQPRGERIDTFSAHLVDLDSQRSWEQLSPAQRASSASQPRRLAWQGANAKRVAEQALPLSQPRLTFVPEVQGFSGLVADASIGAPFSAPVSGEVVFAQGCSLARPANPGQPFIGFFMRCDASPAAREAVAAGAGGAIVLSGSPYDSPPMPVEAHGAAMPTNIPVIVVTEDDGRRIQQMLTAGSLVAALAVDGTARVGTDAEGRPLLFASTPVDPGSTVSHLDPLARPNQLMEPFATPDPSHDLTLTVAMLQDMGWSSRCGNGTVDAGEECDDGEKNDDKTPGACRKDCRRASCGDAVVDSGEDCDEGAMNSERRANACRKDCHKARCGDGVQDEKEECDDGPNNDDKTRDACRTSCRRAYCGDGILDAIEQCDEGGHNDDKRADACRKDCRLPRCGDGAKDRDEECDHGTRNGERAANACRRDCTQARCGDGIVDQGEGCDGSPGCNDSCELPKPEMPEMKRTAEPTASQTSAVQSQPVDGGAETDAGATPAAKSDGGCGCRISRGAPAQAQAGWLWLTLPAVLWIRRSRRRRLQHWLSSSLQRKHRSR